eukprot:gene14893-biopygen5153
MVSTTSTVPWDKRQRTRTGRGAHDRIQRNGHGPDAGVAVSPWGHRASPRHARATPAPVSCDPCVPSLAPPAASPAAATLFTAVALNDNPGWVGGWSLQQGDAATVR